jgi:hypothetical protein
LHSQVNATCATGPQQRPLGENGRGIENGRGNTFTHQSWQPLYTILFAIEFGEIVFNRASIHNIKIMISNYEIIQLENNLPPPGICTPPEYIQLFVYSRIA